MNSHTHHLNWLRRANTLSFSVVLLTLVIVCATSSFALSYYLNSNWFMAIEPFSYPCKGLFGPRACQSEFPPDFDDPPGWYYYWPGINPLHIHHQPQRACVFDFLYHEPWPEGMLRWEAK